MASTISKRKKRSRNGGKDILCWKYDSHTSQEKMEQGKNIWGRSVSEVPAITNIKISGIDRSGIELGKQEWHMKVDGSGVAGDCRKVIAEIRIATVRTYCGVHWFSLGMPVNI